MDKENQQEGKVPNRLICCTEACWEIEADPRHAELVVKQLGIEDRGVSTPGLSGVDEEDDAGDDPLEGEDVTRYRGVIVLCSYLAAGRPDCFFRNMRGMQRNEQAHGWLPQATSPHQLVFEAPSQICFEICHAGRGWRTYCPNRCRLGRMSESS